MKSAAERILYGEVDADGRRPFWRMLTLWSAAAGHATIAVTIDDPKLLDEVVWFGGPENITPTVRRVAERARDIANADLSFPIIMTRSGVVLDGAHRIAKAYLDQHKTISAVVLDDWPLPDGFIAATDLPTGR